VKATIKQLDLAKALDLARRGLPSKTAMPILNHFLITAEQGALHISATDLQLGISAVAVAEVAEDGQFTVDGERFTEWVKGLPPTHPVTLSMPTGKSRNVLSVTAGPASCKINCLDVEDYPVTPTTVDDATMIAVGGEQLATLINQVAIAAAKDASRPVLSGVYVEADGALLTMAAADGFRLAAGSVQLADPLSAKITTIIPAVALRELASMASDQSSPVVAGLNTEASQATAHLFASEWVSSLIEGTFPNFRLIIPREFATEVVIDRADLLAATKRARGFAKDNNDTLRLEIRDASVLVSAIALDRGDTQTVLPAEITGPGLDIMVDERYFTAAVSVLDGEQVYLGFNDFKSAIVIQPSRDAALTHVVMPKVTKAEGAN